MRTKPPATVHPLSHLEVPNRRSGYVVVTHTRIARKHLHGLTLRENECPEAPTGMTLYTLRSRRHHCFSLQVFVIAGNSALNFSRNTGSAASKPELERDGRGKRRALIECERRRMFVRCSHLNLSSFSARMSKTAARFSANPSGEQATFVSRRREVLESR